MEGVHNSEVLLPNTSFTHSISDSATKLDSYAYILMNLLSATTDDCSNFHLKVLVAILSALNIFRNNPVNTTEPPELNMRKYVLSVPNFPLITIVHSSPFLGL